MNAAKKIDDLTFGSTQCIVLLWIHQFHMAHFYMGKSQAAPQPNTS